MPGLEWKAWPDASSGRWCRWRGRAWARCSVAIRGGRQGRADDHCDQPVALVRQLPQNGRDLREGDRQPGRARRQSLRRIAREAAQLSARGERPVRPPDHEQRLGRRDVFRRLRRADRGGRSVLKLDPDIYTLDNTVYFDADKKTMSAVGKVMSVPISPLIPPQASEPLRHRPARRPRPGLRPAMTSIPISTASAAASSRTRRLATIRSRSTTRPVAPHSTITCGSQRKPAIRRPPRSTRPR